MENNQSNNIKNSFEKHFDKEGNPLSWNDIAQKLDQNAGSKIKESFEQIEAPTVLASIPSFEQISQQLTTANNPIKDSFEEVYQNERPDAGIWNSIQNHLDVQRAWLGVASTLNKKTQLKKVRSWLTRISSVAAVLLLLKMCVLDENYFSKPVVIVEQAAQKKYNQKFANQQAHPLTSNAVDNNSPINTIEQPVINHKHSKTNDIIEDQNDESAVYTISNQYVNNEGSSTINKQGNLEATPSFQEENSSYSEINEKSELPFFFTESISEPYTPSDKKSKISSIDEKVSVEKVFNERFAKEYENYILPQREPLLSTNRIASIVLDEKLTTQVLYKTIPNPELLELEQPKRTKARRVSWEIGGAAIAGSSLLWGETMKQSMRTTSLNGTKLKPSFGFEFALLANITKKDAIIATLAPYVSSKQQFTCFSSEGYYKSYQIGTVRSKIAAFYQRQLFDIEFIRTAILVRAGLGIAYINTDEIRAENDHLQQSNTLSKLDVSPKIGLVFRQPLSSRLRLYYGLTSSFGLLDINKQGNLILQGNTHFIQLDISLGLQYRL